MERIVARALSGVRERVIYATKVFPNHLRYEEVVKACDRSLKNLSTDRIDLYQIHWPSGSFKTPKVPIEETLRALNDLKAKGKIRAIGVSNFSRAQIEEAARYGQIVSLQPPYSLFWRQVEADAMPYCVEHNVTTPGLLPDGPGPSDRQVRPRTPVRSGRSPRQEPPFQKETYRRVQAALEKLRPIAARHDCTLAQLALAWVISHPNACAIAGARNAEQAVQNAAAAKVRLSNEDLEQLDGIGRSVTDHLDDNPVMWKF